MSTDREDGQREWRGGVNMVLYSVLFDPELDDSVVASVANMIREGKLVDGGPQRFAGAIEAGLAHSGPLNDVIETPHSEDEIRVFLQKLLHALDTGRTRWFGFNRSNPKVRVQPFRPRTKP